MSEPSDPLANAVMDTIASNPRQVEDWLANRPGAWGFLAGQSILTYRNRLGQRLSEAQRRLLWTALWVALERQRATLQRCDLLDACPQRAHTLVERSI